MTDLQKEGYLRGLQGLPWQAPAETAPARENHGARFLQDVRKGNVPLRGRPKKFSDPRLDAFVWGFSETYPESNGRHFFKALPKLWVRWLESLEEYDQDVISFSRASGREAGEILKREYEEGAAGGLAGFLMDKRLHLDGVRGFLFMRGWLLGTIEHLKRASDPSKKERGLVLESNFSSILLRAQHNAGPGYAAQAAGKLASMMADLDRAAANLEQIEPEASRHLRNNRATILTRALHSGDFDYGDRVAAQLPRAVKAVDAPNKRSLVYRAITNGRLDILLKNARKS